MELSIIIVTWNTADITLKCIESLYKFLSGFNFELVIVDNASTDDTASKISAMGRSALGGKKLKLKINKNNLGYAKACNIGAKIAAGEYLLFLNSDMEIIDNNLISMLTFLKNHPNIGAIGPKFLNSDKSEQASVFPPQTAFNAFKEYFLGYKSYGKYIPEVNYPVSVWAISGGALLIKKELFNLIGGWNEKYFMYYEDLDLCRTIHKHHRLIYYFPQCKIIHRHGASGVNLSVASNQWRRLIPGSIKYHGFINHYLINLIIWSGQKYQKLKSAIFGN